MFAGMAGYSMRFPCILARKTARPKQFMPRSNQVQSTILTAATPVCAKKPIHIIATSFLDGNEVLVRFSDGTAAIYEAEELEKLRPAPKRKLEAWDHEVRGAA